MSLFAFSALSLLIGHYNGYLTCKIAAISKGFLKDPWDYWLNHVNVENGQ